MNIATTYGSTLLAVLLAFLSPSHAQVSRGDLEGLERHRKSREDITVLQTLDGPPATPAGPTSLIGTWDFLDADSESASADGRTEPPAPSLTADALKERVAILPEELQVPWNDQLEQQINDYVVRHRRQLGAVLGKWEYYDTYFRPVFLRHGLPEGLTALSIVESAMDPLAVSRAGAAGIWQFMPETSRRYGLRCDTDVDERFDPYKATEAAAAYLKKAYRRYGDWPLAISSYNCGAASVDRAIALAGTTDYWEVYKYLPSETKGYFPAFVAALYSILYHKEHGITPGNYTEGDIVSFRIQKKMRFWEVIAATGMPWGEVAKLNPQYRTGLIPGDEKAYTLRIPRKYAKKFKENIDKVSSR